MRKIKVKECKKSVVLTCAVILMLSGSGAYADENWTNFTNQVNTTPTNVQLQGNATADSQLTLPPVPGNVTNINGNGHTITSDSTLSQSVINNQENATTTIRDTHFNNIDGVSDTPNYGAAINNNSGATMTVEGSTSGITNIENGSYTPTDFGSSFTNNKVEGNGGAIENSGTLTINNVYFNSNTSDADDRNQYGFGGAIDNYVSSGDANSELNVTNSVFANNSAYSYGGAISNRTGTANISNSIFIGNTATGEVATAGQGGAILNSADMTITHSYFSGNNADNYGGAITNAYYVRDNDVTLVINDSTFVNNRATNGGGAIFNQSSTTDPNLTRTVTVNNSTFRNNTTQGRGGAVFNEGAANANGNDAIFNINGSTFEGNTANNGGGAIYNNGDMRIDNSAFNNNGGSVTLTGGAISNNDGNGSATPALTVTNSTFTNNTAQQYGGAVYNSKRNDDGVAAEVTLTNIEMTGNTTALGTAESGGAIYGAAGSVTNITATDGGKTIIGVTQYGAPVPGANLSTDTISFAGDAVGNFNAEGTGVIELNSTVVGSASSNADSAVNINNGNYTGVVHFKGDGGRIENANVHLYNGELKFDHDASLAASNNLYLHGGLLNLLNNEYSTNQIHAQSLHLLGDTHLKLDVDLGGQYSDSGNPEMDAILKANFPNGITNPSGNTLFIDQMKSVSDAKSDDVRILFTDAEALVGHVELSKGANIVQAPIYKYEVKQETVPYPTTGGGSSSAGMDPGEYFIFDRIGNSDSIIAGPVAAQAAFLMMDNIYRQSFANMDMVTLMTPEERMAWKMRNKYASAFHTGVFAPNMIPEERDGFYVRPFANFENVGLKNGPKVSNVFYGTLIGGESDIIDLGHGWDGNFSFFGAYHGSHQAYNGVDIWQNGGSIGGVATAYKGNFWTGITANIGASAAQASHMYGNDDFPILMTGAAWKSGYNWGLLDNKLVIQPSYMMSYTMVNVFDYTNSAGVRVTQDPLHAIEIIPGLRIIGNLGNGWQPYLGVNLTWNIMDRTKFYADDVALSELSVKPYIEYGVVIMKRKGDRFTGFGQAMIRNGGRNGIALTLGLRWALGH